MWPTLARSRLLHLSAALTTVLLIAPAVRAVDDVEVTVVAILATSDAKNAKIQPEVAAIAREVQKKYPNLTGFRLAQMTCQSMTVGRPDTFTLVDKEAAQVTVEHGADKHDRVRLKVQPPQLKEITYTTCCGKFFPIVTPYQTKDKQEQLIIAVMVSTCKEK
jgi:hypothetical protein